MWATLITFAVLNAGVSVEVRMLDGEKAQGELLKLVDSHVYLMTSESARIPFSELLQLVPLNVGSSSDARDNDIQITFVDDSRVFVQQFSESDGVATISRRGQPYSVPISAIRSVIFQRPTESIRAQWKTIAEQETRGDVLILRRSDSVLDFVEGAIEGVSPADVQFSFDGSQVAVERSRLQGIMYYSANPPDVTPAVCEVTDLDSSTWMVSDVNMENRVLRMTTAAGLSMSIPFDRVTRLDFARGNIVFMTDLEPMRAKWSPYFPSRVVSEYLSKLFQPRFDRGFESEKLRLRFNKDIPRVEEFEKGLAIHSRTEIVYRLPEVSRRFAALAGIDEGVRHGGSVKLVISGDDRILFESTISGPDEPLPIDIPVPNVRRLTILVDFADDLAMADQLNLCNARIIK